MTAALALEPRAGDVLGLHQATLPAVLHSPAYAAAQPTPPALAHRAHHEIRAARDRRWREQMLTSLAGRYRMVIGVHALYALHTHRPDLARGQAGHLIRLIDQDRVALQILPTHCPPGDIQQGFIVLRHIPHQTDHAYLQQNRDWAAVPELAAHLVSAWDQIQRIALPVADTRAHLHHLHHTGDISHLTPNRAMRNGGNAHRDARGVCAGSLQ
jgi:uncharacterized protein DUF5753